MFEAALGEGFHRLPKAVQKFHSFAGQPWVGRAHIQRQNTIFASVLSSILGLPKTASEIPISVEAIPAVECEAWIRDFNGQILKSHLKLSTTNGCIWERFGPFNVEIALTLKDQKLYFIPQRWRFAGVPMPRFLLPSGNSYECEKDGRFHFDVVFEVPFLGKIVSYTGWLET